MLLDDLVELKLGVQGHDLIDGEEVDATVSKLMHVHIDMECKPKELHVLLGDDRF